MKNILIIAPTLTKGGMERQLSILLEHYDRSKFNITLALLRNKIEYNISNDIEIIQLNKNGKIDLKFYLKLFQLLRQDKWDVIHSKISGLNEQIMFFCGMLNINSLIVEIRSSGRRLYKNYKNMNTLFKIFNKYSKWKVVSNSKKAKEELNSFLNVKVDITVIYNAIDTNKFKKLKVKENDKFIIGFVGRIQPVKNIEIILEVLKDLDENIILEIYGSKDNIDYYNKLLNIIKQYNLQKRVQFFDAVDNVEYIYNRFNLFILSSHHEGTPNVLLEAMACERVCLVSNGANSDDYLDSKFTFCTTDSNDLAKKFTDIFEFKKNKKNEIGKLNRIYIINQFAINKMLTCYEKVWIDEN